MCNACALHSILCNMSNSLIRAGRRSRRYCLEQTTALMAVVAEEDRTRNRDGEAEAQPCGHSTPRADRQIHQLNFRPGQPAAFTLNDDVAQEGLGRVLVPSGMPGRGIFDVAFPDPSRTKQPQIVARDTQADETKPPCPHSFKRRDHAIKEDRFPPTRPR